MLTPSLSDHESVSGLKSILKKETDDKPRYRKTVHFSRYLPHRWSVDYSNTKEVPSISRIPAIPPPAVTVKHTPIRGKPIGSKPSIPAWKENLRLNKDVLPSINPDRYKLTRMARSTPSVTRQPSIHKQADKPQQYTFPELSKKPQQSTIRAEKTTRIPGKQRTWRP